MPFDILAPSSSSDAPWIVAEARAVLEGLLDRLDAAFLVLSALVDDTAWRSSGIAALHRRLGEVSERIRSAIIGVCADADALAGWDPAAP